MMLTRCKTSNPIDRVFDSLNYGLFPSFRGFWEGDAKLDDNEPLRLPRTNIEETKDSYVFTLEMPGLTKKDVEVSLENDTLTITGHKEEKTEREGVLRREIRSSRFERSFSLGTSVDQGQIKAKMENGVLTVTLPKRPEKVGRKVEIA